MSDENEHNFDTDMPLLASSAAAAVLLDEVKENCEPKLELEAATNSKELVAVDFNDEVVMANTESETTAQPETEPEPKQELELEPEATNTAESAVDSNDAENEATNTAESAVDANDAENEATNPTESTVDSNDAEHDEMMETENAQSEPEFEPAVPINNTELAIDSNNAAPEHMLTEIAQNDTIAQPEFEPEPQPDPEELMNTELAVDSENAAHDDNLVTEWFEQQKEAAVKASIATQDLLDLRMQRQTSNSSNSSSSIEMPLLATAKEEEQPPAKMPKLEEVLEHKSIIEVCLSNDDVKATITEQNEQKVLKKEIKQEQKMPKQELQQEIEQREHMSNDNKSDLSFMEIETKTIKHNDNENDNDDADSIMSEDEADLPPEPMNEEEQMRDAEMRALGKSFLQHLPCFKLPLSENVPKCRECSRRRFMQQQQEQEEAAKAAELAATTTATAATDTIAAMPTAPTTATTATTQQTANSDVYCRFYEFRRMQYNADGLLTVTGWPDPYKDVTPSDTNVWLPDDNTEPTASSLDIQTCRYILLHVGDQFCYLWRQEVEALDLHENSKKAIAWKKLVQGVREICDVCDTTLFNYHWTCEQCGFSVCMECVRDRKQETVSAKTRANDKQRRVDEYHWLLCAKRCKHEIAQLMLTQIIAGHALHKLGELMHEVRQIWQVPQLCRCMLSKQQLITPPHFKSYVRDIIKEECLKIEAKINDAANADEQQHIKDIKQIKTEIKNEKASNSEELPSFKQQRLKKLQDAIERIKPKCHVQDESLLGKDPIENAFEEFKHINFHRKGLAGWRRFLPPRSLTLSQSSKLAPGVPHDWLCDGKLLRLTNAAHPYNSVLFQEVWKCGQPVMISHVARTLNLALWHPKAFCADFGHKNNDLINCLTGNLVPNQPMRHFWEGFECIKKRLLDVHGRPMLLKLKDWPPGDDFAELLPTRYTDLMKGLPLPEYTLRTGVLNIASCLPKMFVPPDLGPKMYNAYGSAFHPNKGTTNLHLDISDAVNIMVYVGIPQDVDSRPQLTATQRAIALGGCDFMTRARVQDPAELPGALWHIFPARDADKIRDLLNRVTIERGFRLEPDHDPIHDQNWYLDDKLRERLFNEYGVEGFTIVQCQGDAVFIPAGAPHQVQNLHNCIKVAEDFVSPENITHCYHLTHEFRRLSHSHTNHEDKLQIKNIIYHAIKDCCTVLTRALDKRLDQEIADAKAARATLRAMKAAK